MFCIKKLQLVLSHQHLAYPHLPTPKHFRMNNDRRKFLQSTSLLATTYLLAKPLKSIAGVSTNNFLSRRLQLNAINIIHTGNLHGKLYPFALGDLNNVGGLHNIHSIVKDSRMAPMVVDAGGFLGNSGLIDNDINLVRQMGKTGYTAVTIGDKELAKGEAYLASLVPYMDFTVVNCNYNFSDAALKAKVSAYHIVRHGQYKIGITGVGPINSNVAGSDPVKKANEVAGYLKNELNCDLVICLSQLGYEQKSDQTGNKAFAAASENIDIIIGGHDKTVVHPQLIIRNNEKKQVVLSNGGFGGAVLGTVTFGFNDKRGLQTFNCKNYVPGTNAGSSFHDNYTKITA